MQYLSYEKCDSLSGVQKEIRRLVEQRFLTEEQAEAVPPAKLLRFFQSELGQRVLAAEKPVREFKFSVLEDAGQYDAELAGEQLLLQGVTDCCILEKDGLVILDFKSDRVKEGEEAERAEHYRGQMEAYSRALSRIFEMPVKERILYFFATDTAFLL
jgi:ATP-dependent helicase/nuclease subunit A